jgi:hypothetical protein
MLSFGKLNSVELQELKFQQSEVRGLLEFGLWAQLIDYKSRNFDSPEVK